MKIMNVKSKKHQIISSLKKYCVQNMIKMEEKWDLD